MDNYYTFLACWWENSEVCVSQSLRSSWKELPAVITFSLTYILLAFPSFPVSFFQIPPVHYWDDPSNKLLAPKSLSKALFLVDPKGADSECWWRVGWSAFSPSWISKLSGMWTQLSAPLPQAPLPVDTVR